MYKIFSIFLITVSTNTLATLDLQNHDLTLRKDVNKIIEEENDREPHLSQTGKYEPNGIAARDQIKLGLSPGWTAVADNVDRERSGYKSIHVACIKKNCKKDESDINNELAQIGEKFKR